MEIKDILKKLKEVKNENEKKILEQQLIDLYFAPNELVTYEEKAILNGRKPLYVPMHERTKVDSAQPLSRSTKGNRANKRVPGHKGNKR